MPRAPRTHPHQVLGEGAQQGQGLRLQSHRRRGGFPGFPLLFELSVSTGRPGADGSREALRRALLGQIR